jgi:hypothetical protein
VLEHLKGFRKSPYFLPAALVGSALAGAFLSNLFSD